MPHVAGCAIGEAVHRAVLRIVANEDLCHKEAIGTLPAGTRCTGVAGRLTHHDGARHSLSKH